MRDLVVFGSVYRDLVKLIDAINRDRPTWRLRGFIDDRVETAGTQVFGRPVLGGRERLPDLARSGSAFFSNVSGSVVNARMVANLLESLDRPIASLIHPAIDLSYVELGRGCLLPEGCVLGSGSVIGNYLSARLHVVISHDVRIDDFVFVGPGTVIGSEAHIESGAFLGAGVTVMTGCRIGAHSVIGAGALVAADIPPGVTVAAVRGRVARHEGRA